MFKSQSLIALVCILLFPAITCHADANDLSVAGYELVAKRRLDSTFFEYTFAVNVSNGGEPLNSVVGTLTSSSRTTILMDDEIVLGDIGTGTFLSTDTIKFRQDRRIVFDANNLFWSFTAEVPPTNTPPVADAGPDQNVAIGSVVTLNGSASADADNDTLTYSWTLITPPESSASLSDAAAVMPTFTADVQGEFTATLVVDDGTVNSVPDSVAITAEFEGDNRPVITSTPITTGSLSTLYSYDVDATDADAGDVLTYELLTAPAGMSIDENSGLISWIPSQSGPADVDVQVSDSTGLTDRQIFLILVNAGDDDQPPSLQPIADQTTITGMTLTLTAVGSDPENETLRYSLLLAPDGMGINAATGELQWTPGTTQTGTANATVSVQDPGGQSAQQSFNVEVSSEGVNARPELAPISDQQVNVQDTVSVVLMATDADVNDILTFSLEGTPAGAQFDAPAGTLNWIPTSSDVDTYSLTATVTDSAGATDSRAFSITVLEPPMPPAAPVAVDDAYAIRRGDVLNVAADGVLTNDTDANGDVLTAAKTSDPVVGSLNQFGMDGSFSYATPTPPPITIGLSTQCGSVGGSSMAGIPLVADLDGDGLPEIIVKFNSSFSNVRLQVRDGATCDLIAETSPGLNGVYGLLSLNGAPAVGDIDGDGDLEILAGLSNTPTGAGDLQRFAAFDHELNYLWTSETLVNFDINNNNDWWVRDNGLTIADIDGDGSAEILLGYAVSVGFQARQAIFVAYSGEGQILWETFGSPTTEGGIGNRGGSYPVQVADLDLDGTMEVLYHKDVFSHTGDLEFSWPTEPPPSGDPTRLTTAVANFDADPYPEIVGHDHRNLYLFNHDGSIAWQQSTIGQDHPQGFPITVADIDGDGQPEIVYPGAIAGNFGDTLRYALRAYEGDGSVRWTGEAVSDSRHTRVQAFDLDADGSDELIYLTLGPGGSDTTLRIVNGADGVEIDQVYVGRRLSEGYNAIAIADTDADGAAEIVFVGSFTPGFGVGAIAVLEGLPGNPFAPARPIYNEWGYQPNLVNADGTVKSNLTPHWLVPGLNGHNLMAVVPGEPGAGDQDSFTYVASDGTADSNEATVSITIAPNVNPPLIVSQPPLGASPGFDYEYGLLSTDADFGDTLTYTLIDAPTGMSIDSFGILSWTPPVDATGTVSVYIVVTDSQNNTDTQQYEITVLPPVEVPDLSGLDAMMAGDELIGAGLALGNVTQSYSLTVPAGQVISQSIAGGETSAAGAIINIVISLGVQPVFVPTLVELEQLAADNSLINVGLVTGTISLQNSDTIARGSVIAQSPQPFTSLEPGDAVNLVVSSGPSSVVNLTQSVLGQNESTTLDIALFDTLGNPVALPADLVITVETAQGALGALPQVNGTDILTGADSEGTFLVRATSATASLDKSEEFSVHESLGQGKVQEPYARLSGSINRLNSLYGQLAEAARNNDTAALQTLGIELANERAQIDLEALRGTPPIAPSEGFIPTGTVSQFPATDFDTITFPNRLLTVRASLVENRTFYERLDPNAGRDDDLRTVVLNRNLRDAANELFLAEPSIDGYLINRSLVHEVLSISIPQLLTTQADAILEELQGTGLLAQRNGRWQAVRNPTGYASEIRDLRESNRALFFSLAGIMSATQIQTSIIKDVYFPVIKRVVLQSTLLVLDGLIREFMDVTDLTGVITLASLSFHFFEADNSIIEVPGGPTGAGSYLVTFIGPDLPQGIADALDVVNDAKDNPPTDIDGAKQLGQAFLNTINGALNGVKRPTADQDLRGCFLSPDPNCHQLVFNDGFPVVFTLGDGFGAGLPAPVLIYVYDVINQSIYASTQAFYPTPATPEASTVEADRVDKGSAIEKASVLKKPFPGRRVR